MIVKDESAVIKRCLDSIKDIIDHWVIIDTGSTDNTKDLIKSLLKNIPGTLENKTWVNFGHNRTELIQLAKGKSDYLLLLDADMEVVLDPKFSKNLDADGYSIRYNGDLDYTQQLLVKGDLDWQYIGVTHEYIQSSQCKIRKELKYLRITHYADGNSHQEKFKRDIKLLKQEVKNNPNDSRSVFYLAQTYRDINDYETAKNWYIKRTTMGGWNEELWYAMYQTGEMYKRLGEWNHALEWYFEAYSFRPNRAEPLYPIIAHYAAQKNYQLAYLFAKAAMKIPYPKDSLFVEKPIYNHLIKDQLAVCAYYTKNMNESKQLCEELLKMPELTNDNKKRILSNKVFATNMEKRLIFGLGTGRCGTVSLQKFLNFQKNTKISHEAIVSPWVFNQHYLDQLVNHIQQYAALYVGDVAFYYLNYVEQILKIYPDAKFICLQRNKQETVKSYLAWTSDKQHWTHRNSKQWKPGKEDKYDDSYPKYMMPKQEAINAYWDDYYRHAYYLQRQYPQNFKTYSTDQLNSREGQIEILSFIGCKPKDMVLNVGIQENRYLTHPKVF